MVFDCPKEQGFLKTKGVKNGKPERDRGKKLKKGNHGDRKRSQWIAKVWQNRDT